MTTARESVGHGTRSQRVVRQIPCTYAGPICGVKRARHVSRRDVTFVYGTGEMFTRFQR